MDRFDARRRTVGALAGALALAAGVRPAVAQATFPIPGKPIRVLVPLAAGGSLDFQARTLAQRVSEMSGLQVVVENKPGASMMLAASEVARAQPDGHTLIYAASSIFAQNPHTLLNVPYDPFKDFTPVTISARGPLVLTVTASMPANNVRELVAWGKANPGKLIFGSFGMGTSSHVYAEAFAKAAGVEIVHVPYKGTADAVRDLFEGRINAYFDAAPTAITNSQTGRVRMLGVGAPQRSPYIPNVPTFNEQGLAGIDLPSFVCLVGPAGIPPEVLTKVNALFTAALATPQIKEAFSKGAYEPSPSTPAELAAEIRSSYDRWGAMIKAIGFQKQ